MDKRYQVFVSSTFIDLQQERQEVMQALLELDCIPAGMELFPAGNDDQWSLIKKVIDDCDYYVVIIGGRYGSEGPEGLGYTEMEYRYAVEKGKPVMAFLHKSPGELAAIRSEKSREGQEKLEAFRQLVQQRICRFWENPSDLGSQVSRSLVKLIKSNPAIGWIKADATTADASRELLRLRERIEELERELEAVRVVAPEGTDQLAQGDDPFHFRFTAVWAEENGDYEANESFRTKWDEILKVLGPFMIGDASDDQLATAFEDYLRRRYIATTQRDCQEIRFEAPLMNIIKVQLRALGLITKSAKPRSIKDTATYWTLTPYGDESLTRLSAVRRRPLIAEVAPAQES